MSRVPAVGERFELAEESIYGYVSSIVEDVDGEPAALVIEMDNGKWASVALNCIVWHSATLH